MGTPVPKPYLLLGGKPILSYSIEKFSQSPLISEIVLVIHPDDRKRLEGLLKGYAAPPEIEVVLGGEHRQESALVGVRAIRSRWVAVHDGARPLFTLGLLERVFEAARRHRAALPALPVQETVKTVDPEGYVLGEVEREPLRLARTPQCFERELLLRSLQEAQKKQRRFTDEAGAVLAMGGVRARVVPGEVQNIKITRPEDLRLAEALLEAGLAA